MEKLFTAKLSKEYKTRMDNYFKDKILQCFFIRVDKVFVIHRNPITPYMTEKNTENLIFIINKVNTKPQQFRFLKIYDGLLRTQDETSFLNYLIDSTISEGIKEFKEIKQVQQGSEITMLYKARKIVPEGVIWGIFAIVDKTKFVFYSLVNCVQNKIWEFNLSDIKAFIKYRYMFKHQGIEIWLYNKKRSFLLVLEDKHIMEQVFKYLKENCDKTQQYGTTQQQITELWQKGQISNFEYLMSLNTLANRSFNDLSQYPIFPWIIFDNHSQNFDLTNPKFFRDLTKPVGAINKHRL